MVTHARAAQASVIYLEDLRDMEARSKGRTRNTRLSASVRGQIVADVAGPPGPAPPPGPAHPDGPQAWPAPDRTKAGPTRNRPVPRQRRRGPARATSNSWPGWQASGGADAPPPTHRSRRWRGRQAPHTMSPRPAPTMRGRTRRRLPPAHPRHLHPTPGRAARSAETLSHRGEHKAPPTPVSRRGSVRPPRSTAVAPLTYRVRAVSSGPPVTTTRWPASASSATASEQRSGVHASAPGGTTA